MTVAILGVLREGGGVEISLSDAMVPSALATVEIASAMSTAPAPPNPLPNSRLLTPNLTSPHSPLRSGDPPTGMPPWSALPRKTLPMGSRCRRPCGTSRGLQPASNACRTVTMNSAASSATFHSLLESSNTTLEADRGTPMLHTRQWQPTQRPRPRPGKPHLASESRRETKTKRLA